MKLFEGKTKSERNKTIAAIVLGGASLIVLFFAFGRGMFTGRTTTVAVKPSPTPRIPSGTQSDPGRLRMPSAQDQMLEMTTQPVAYRPGSFYAPDAGRNIFAFYEPPKPTPYVPTPVPVQSMPPPTPAPTPDIIIAAVNPQSVYAGANGFRMDIAGERFTPDTKIYFEQQEIPASYVNESRMTVNIPASLIRSDGRRSIMAQTVDGIKRSNPILFDIQPPPKPTFQYIGMIARTRGNNDTAYFQEQGKPLPTPGRLNDVVGGRFRVISISASEVVLEDIQLSFSKPRLALHSPPPTATTSQPGPGMGQPPRGFPGGRQTYTPVNPGTVNPSMPVTNSRIPGIPDNIPRYIPPQPNPPANRANTKPDIDEDDDGMEK